MPTLIDHPRARAELPCDVEERLPVFIHPDYIADHNKRPGSPAVLAFLIAIEAAVFFMMIGWVLGR